MAKKTGWLGGQGRSRSRITYYFDSCQVAVRCYLLSSLPQIADSQRENQEEEPQRENGEDCLLEQQRKIKPTSTRAGVRAERVVDAGARCRRWRRSRSRLVVHGACARKTGPKPGDQELMRQNKSRRASRTDRGFQRVRQTAELGSPSSG